jgi:hypothetical protein
MTIELNSYTGAYVMQMVGGKIIVTGRTKYKNFKAVFPIHEVEAFLKQNPEGGN